jgi:hypothetical protein
MVHLIIGGGEVGMALQKIFKCEVHDPNKGHIAHGKYDILHICIPYSKDFENEAKKYKKQFKAKYLVIHSTVTVGTCSRLRAVSSPVLGIHPHLEEGMRTFTKFLGGPKASEVADEFRRVGLRVYIFEKSETTELMKILDTTFYGICIEYTKDVKKQTERFKVPFEAWTLWTNNYNEGYVKLGHPEYIRPNLVPIMTPQGGHCTIPNTYLLDTPFTKILKDTNEKEINEC